jgi:benzodiazapine receptor
MKYTLEDAPSKARSTIVLIAWLIGCFAAPALSALVGAMPGDWYAALKKPSWNPPGWIFGPVWTALYTMMAVSAWLVWKQGGWAAQRKPLLLFVVQLTLNAAWTPLFFRLHAPGWAAVDITLLWLAIVGTIVAFRPVGRVAAVLLWPYLAWVSFAAVLNFTLWWMNA